MTSEPTPTPEMGLEAIIRDVEAELACRSVTNPHVHISLKRGLVADSLAFLRELAALREERTQWEEMAKHNAKVGDRRDNRIDNLLDERDTLRAELAALREAVEELVDSAMDTLASGRPEASMDSAVDKARVLLDTKRRA